MSEWNHEPVEIDEVEVIVESPKSILCRFEDGRESWIPKSQISHDSDVREHGDYGTLTIPSWLAEKEGLV